MEKNQVGNNRDPKRSSNIWMGLIFIFGGIIFLLNQLDLLPFELNWWALFIMLPAAGSLGGAYYRFRTHNNLFSMDVLFPALIGVFMVGLSISLLVGASWNVNWNLLWPFVIIIIGLGMIFNRTQKG